MKFLDENSKYQLYDSPVVGLCFFDKRIVSLEEANKEFEIISFLLLKDISIKEISFRGCEIGKRGILRLFELVRNSAEIKKEYQKMKKFQKIWIRLWGVKKITEDAPEILQEMKSSELFYTCSSILIKNEK